MKKKFVILLLFVLMVNIVGVKAETLSDYLPGGKNYIDRNNFVVSNNSVNSINDILIKSSTVYTLSFPGFDRIGENIAVNINGINMYIEGNVLGDSNCTVNDQQTECTFETSSNEDYISIFIASDYLEYYMDSYDFYGFQLEEGATSTSYEQYVNPDVVINEPEISGIGAYIKSYSIFESIGTIIENHIYVLDEIDGYLTSSIIIESDSYTGNEQIVGEYLVNLSVSDLSNNAAYFSLTILVKDEISPIITGPSEIEVGAGDTIDINTIVIDYFDVYDEYSTVSINILEDNYTPNTGALGTYLVTFEVIDESFNTTTKTLNVSIVDNDSPIIISDLNIDSFLTDAHNLSSVLNTLEFSDNFSDMSDVSIVVLEDRFSGNENIPGVYSITFEVMDQSLNTVEGIINITVIDDILPQISGPVSYQGSYEENLVVSDFLDMLTISDNISILNLNDVLIIEDNYTNRSSSTGDYTITFEVSDENNNIATHSINIKLIDDVAPVVYIDNYIVTIDVSSTFTNEDALTLLLNSNELVEGSYKMNTIFDGYTGNESSEGTYIYLVEFTNELGESFEKEFIVKVINESISNVNSNFLLRNIILYSISVIVFGVVVIKNKKV